MAVLLDTSILGRLANPLNPAYAVAHSSVVKLHRQNELLNITAQNLVEFRAFATRPVAVNGLGLLPADAAAAAAAAASFENIFPLLEETPAIYPAWRSLVDAVGVIGKQVHDARLVAAGHIYGVKQLLTFNLNHFVRLTSGLPSITLIHPANV